MILHGLFGMSDNLQMLGKGLAEQDFMVFLVDQRDHGRSPHTSAFDYPTLANDLRNFMENQWLHQTALIGHSMGGKTALQFIAEYPGVVHKLVIIDIGIKKYPGGHEEIIQALDSIPLDKIKIREEVFDILMGKIHDTGTVQFLMKNLTRNKETQSLEWKFNLPLLKSQYQNILQPVTFSAPEETEVLFIKGELSGYIEETDKKQIQQWLPNARFVTIPEAGHWVHADKPRELLEEISSFLKT